MHFLLINPDQADLAYAKQLRPKLVEHWAVKPGARLMLTLAEEEDIRSLQQNRYYWGFLLKQISQQCRINGIGATAQGWHQWMKDRYLAPRFKKVMLPGQANPLVVREPASTRGLSVAAFSKYLQQVEAEAVSDYGCVLPAGVSWQSYEEW